VNGFIILCRPVGGLFSLRAPFLFLMTFVFGGGYLFIQRKHCSQRSVNARRGLR